MAVPHLLLETLEDLRDNDFKTMNWYLTTCDNLLDGCSPIPRSRLEKAERIDTVTEIIQRYGPKRAVDITLVILKKINNNYAAVKLEEAYAAAEKRAAKPSTSSSALATPAAAPATISAHDGSVVIAPMVSGGAMKDLKITINNK